MRETYRGRAWGAISFLNAIPTGVGSAAAVRLPLTVELSREGGGEALSARADSSPLVRSTLEEAERAGAKVRQPLSFRVRSQIPEGQGLKSSSALTVALLRALFAASSLPPPEGLALARMSSRAAQSSGESLTGAFDDALASALGEAVVADNRRLELLARPPLDPRWAVWIRTAQAPHAPPEELRRRWAQGADPRARQAEQLAREGRLLEAMTLNGAVVEEALGYDYSRLRNWLQERGALACGVSGNGPALAAVFDSSRLPGDALDPPSPGRTLCVPFAVEGDGGAA